MGTQYDYTPVENEIYLLKHYCIVIFYHEVALETVRASVRFPLLMKKLHQVFFVYFSMLVLFELFGGIKLSWKYKYI